MLRLRNAAMGYSYPTRRAYLINLDIAKTIYCLRNLLTLGTWFEGLDPESHKYTLKFCRSRFIVCGMGGTAIIL